MKTDKFYELYVGSSEAVNGGKSVFLKTNKSFEEALQDKMVLEFSVLEKVITEEEMNDINSGSGFLIEIDPEDIDEGCKFVRI